MAAARWCLRFSFFLLVFLCLPEVTAAQSARQQLTDEVARLRKLIAEQPDDGDLWKNIGPSTTTGLDRIAKDLDAGRTLVALRGLAFFRTNLLAYAYLAAHLDIAKDDMKAFDAQRQRMDGELRRAEEKYRAGQWGNQPAAVRAAAEASWGTARPLYDASRDYAAATATKYGLFYLGQAQAAVDFALFCRELHFESSAGQFAVRSFAYDTDALNGKVEAAYQPPLSIERHPDFIAINAWIKRATEMDQGRLYYGALFAYLEGVRSFADMQTAIPAKDELPGLGETHTSLVKRFDEAGRDHSIAQMYLDLAARELERAQAGEESSGRIARVLVEQVVPAYAAAVARTSVPPATPSQKVVTVTLVRWPFT